MSKWGWGARLYSRILFGRLSRTYADYDDGVSVRVAATS